MPHAKLGRDPLKMILLHENTQILLYAYVHVYVRYMLLVMIALYNDAGNE